MCIRDSVHRLHVEHLRHHGPAFALLRAGRRHGHVPLPEGCLLYTSDAADERSSVDLGGRRIIKKKKPIDILDRLTIEKKIKLLTP